MKLMTQAKATAQTAFGWWNGLTVLTTLLARGWSGSRSAGQGGAGGGLDRGPVVGPQLVEQGGQPTRAACAGHRTVVSR
jgi:hypothetical protein